MIGRNFYWLRALTTVFDMYLRLYGEGLKESPEAGCSSPLQQVWMQSALVLALLSRRSRLAQIHELLSEQWSQPGWERIGDSEVDWSVKQWEAWTDEATRPCLGFSDCHRPVHVHAG